MAKNDFRGRDSFSLGFLSLLDFPLFRLETSRASYEDLNISTVCQFLNFATVEILLNSLPFQACNYLYELLCYANDLMRFSKLRPCYCSGLVFRWRSLRSWLSKSARKSAEARSIGHCVLCRFDRPALASCAQNCLSGRAESERLEFLGGLRKGRARRSPELDNK